MSLSLIILWVALISVFAVFAAWYAGKFGRADALIALYVVLVSFANLAVGKMIEFDLGVATFFAPATVLVFSVTFLLTDIVNERFGRAETQRMIAIAIVSQIAILTLSQLVLQAEGAPFFEHQAAFETVFGSVPRIVIASLIAFALSENVDAWLFHWLRGLTHGRHLWIRNAFSSLPAMALDSTIFTALAFAGVLPIWPIILGDIVIKWLVGVADVPFMYLSRAVLGRSERGNRA